MAVSVHFLVTIPPSERGNALDAFESVAIQLGGDLTVAQTRKRRKELQVKLCASFEDGEAAYHFDSFVGCLSQKKSNDDLNFFGKPFPVVNGMKARVIQL